MTYVAAPPYGRKKADQIINRITNLALSVQESDATSVQITLSPEDTVILANMLYEMDRHLPNFFEVLPEDEGDAQT